MKTYVHPDEHRAAMVRAVVARDWAVAMAVGAHWFPHFRGGRLSVESAWDEARDRVVEQVAGLPCADDFVADILGES